MTALSRDVAIAGVGYSEFTRHGTPDPRALTFTAVMDALGDAGVQGADVDGIFEFTFNEAPTSQMVARMIGARDLAAFTDIIPNNPSGLGGPLSGAMAVASGVCETVVAYRCITREAGYQGGVRGSSEPVPGLAQFTGPYGYNGGILMNVAMKKQRWMQEYNRPEDDFGLIAVNARKWAAMNPRAVLRDPITMDDYLSARTIVPPLRVLDCDYPVSGAAAVVITTAERARDLRQPPVLIDSMTYGTGPKVDWLFVDDFLYGGAWDCAKRLWDRSSVTVDDVDVAQLYDGFTAVTLSWIEALGFCGRGESGDWLDGGKTIGPGGRLPVNTSGGQLAEGRLHAMAGLNEAVLQVRGQAGERQVPGAEVSLIASGLYPQCGGMVLIPG